MFQPVCPAFDWMDAYTRIIEDLVEAECFSKAVDMVDTCMNSTSYPQSRVLQILVHEILSVSTYT